MCDGAWCSGAACSDGTACGAVEAWLAALGEERAAAEVEKIVAVLDAVAASGRAARIRTPAGVCHIAYLVFVHRRIGRRALVARGFQAGAGDGAVEIAPQKNKM